MGDEAREEARGEARVPPRSLSGKLLDVLGTFQADHAELTLSRDQPAQRAAADHHPPPGPRPGHLGGAGARARRARTTSACICGRSPRSPRAGLGLREIALPYLEDLYEATHENVQLAVRDGLEVVFVERLAGRDAVRVLTRVGGRFALHATGVGLVLLAHAPADVQEQVLGGPLERWTPKTIGSPRAAAPGPGRGAAAGLRGQRRSGHHGCPVRRGPHPRVGGSGGGGALAGGARRRGPAERPGGGGPRGGPRDLPGARLACRAAVDPAVPAPSRTP